jgi:serine/threonine-protein kinase
VPQDLGDRLASTIGAQYAIERELGGGGMSRVFLATDIALGRRVVVKVLSPELAASLSHKRFEREIRLAASLQQANIVPVLAAGETDGVPYYAMPFVDGLSLRERLTSRGRPSLPDTIAILRDVARALAYAHERGVVHRDIKPENILLSGGAAVVTDFGIAKALASARVGDAGTEVAGRSTVTQVGTAVGTPAYMAPEQIAGDPSIDHRVDLYSFGCLAYELLSGKTPFSDRAVHALFSAHLSETPAPVAVTNPECPPALARLVMRCLAKDPSARPQSAQEILATLDAATTATALERFRQRFTTRQRIAAWTVFAALFAAVAALAIRRRPSGTTADVSIAVLPFVNVGGDSAKNIWADGLTDEVTTVLARRPRTRLATRAAVDRYRGRQVVDAREAARVLHVRHVLQATVWPQGPQLRVVAVLSNGDDGIEVWRETFTRPSNDILVALDSITSGIAIGVQRRMSGTAGPSLADVGARSVRGTSDTAAYYLYLSAQTLLRRRGAGVLLAVRDFENAIARDSNYAKAYSGLSAALGVLPNFADTTSEELYERATSTARRALALDSTLGEAHASLALAYMNSFRWAQADSEFQLAMKSDPADAYVYMQYGRFLTYVGRLREAVDTLRRAKSLDPTSPVISAWLANDLDMFGRKTEAYAEIDRALELDSTNVPTVYFGAHLSVARGQRDRARRLAELVWRPNGLVRPAPWPAGGAEIYAALGDTATARTIQRFLENVPRSRSFGHSALAGIAMALGDTTRALDEFDRAQDAHELWPSTPTLLDAGFDPMRRSKRFAALVARAGLDVKLFTSPTGGRPR